MPARSEEILESGSVQVPYSDHCGGAWEVRPDQTGPDQTASDQTASITQAMRAAFSVECAARGDGEPSCLRFNGLYDGERIAGTVCDGAADREVGEFLCTRLYTFWGPPKLRATPDP